MRTAMFPAAAHGRHRRGPRARRLAWRTTGLLGLLCTWGAVQAAQDCAALATWAAGDAAVTAAGLVPAGQVVAGQVLPAAMCRVQGVARPSADSHIQWEVWLPHAAGAWTGRLKLNGTGGFAGAIPYARLNQDVADGFVTAGSNMGHDGGESAAWTLGRPEKVKDWGLRAHASVAVAAKALAAAYFGAPVKHAYFEGCSNGGRQAMMLAQNYPDLFDGIVAGAPSMFYPDLLMWLLWSGKTLMPAPAPALPALSGRQRQAITQRVLQACDASDGLADGQITNPRACQFRIGSMGPQGDGTLTAAELQVAQRMYNGPQRRPAMPGAPDAPDGDPRYGGAQPGSEADWSPHFADNGGYGPFVGHVVYGQPSPPFDWRQRIDWDGVYDQVKAVLTPVTAAPSPDLRRFVARGGKLLQTHGWNDSVVPPDGSTAYFLALTQWAALQHLPSAEIDRRAAALTPAAVAAGANEWGPAVRQFHRLFMLPATSHCGGGTGPSAVGGGMPEPPAAWRNAEHHAVSALLRWVEQGVAPDKIVATRFDGQGRPTRSRPLCAYPAKAVYKGAGDIDDAANFECQATVLRAQDLSRGELATLRDALGQRGVLLPHR